jgi:aryl-alcohol dehydrogenase-like predicted oxidoreductase
MTATGANNMEKRRLGGSGIEIPPLVFGGNVFGWTADEATSFRLLDALVAAGFNAIDTADVYSVWARGHRGGESETVIGNWLKRRGRRDDVIIATKVGAPMGSGDKGLSRAWIMQEVDASLQRLQTDVIDLYQAHRDDPDTPQEETAQAFAELVKQGKVRALGASNFSAARLQSALEVSRKLGVPRYESLQPHYNLVERPAYETELEPLCRAEGLGVINYYALAAGFLTGKYRSAADLSKSPRGGGVRKYLSEHGFRVLTALDDVAARHGATPAQVALAWLIARPGVTAPIASATSLEQLHDILGAVELQLDTRDITTLDTASA